MPGRFTPFPTRRSLRALVAVPYRQAGVIVACALAGVVASLLLSPREALPQRLDEARRLAHAGRVEFQRELDAVDLSLHLPPTGAGRRAIAQAATPAVETGGVSPRGPVTGLLLGLLLAAWRELRGDRMRSSRDAERALGLPVLGALPTLSIRVRNAYAMPTEPA